MQPTLPSEIIDIIVDHVGSESHTKSSRDGLRALALVSVALLTRAYYYLYDELHLVLSSSNAEKDRSSLTVCEKKLASLHEILAGGLPFPGIALVHHIRSVRISFVFEKKRDMIAISQLPQLSGILNALHGPDHGIKTLNVEILDFPMTPIAFRRTYPIHLFEGSNNILCSALDSLCHSQRLTTVHLTNVGLRLRELCGTNVEELHLEQCMFTDQDKNDPDAELDENDDNVLRLKSMTLADVRHSLSPTTKSSNLLAKIAHAFHPSSAPANSLTDPLIPLVFSNLTSLTLQDDDYTTPLTAFPALCTLRIIQNIFWMRRTMGFMTKLRYFFLPAPGTVRSLGSTQHLIVETDVNFREIFFDDGEDARLWDAWDIVDAHLTGNNVSSTSTGQIEPTSTGLQSVHFLFRFRIQPGRYLSYQEEPLFIERNRKNLLDRFPLLVSGNYMKFTMDVLVDRENRIEPSVRCKGPVTGWW
uniref:Uncharacterized protein n=1 Tax=Psilocybe cubensis TaxID=181762 RepID=A0A8H8CNK9_PSICU